MQMSYLNFNLKSLPTNILLNSVCKFRNDTTSTARLHALNAVHGSAVPRIIRIAVKKFGQVDGLIKRRFTFSRVKKFAIAGNFAGWK